MYALSYFMLCLFIHSKKKSTSTNLGQVQDIVAPLRQDSNYRNGIDESLVHWIQHNGKTSCACYALLKFLDIIKIFVKIQTWDLLCTVTTQAEKNKERSATLVFITFCIG